ncbi:MAG: ribonuclease H-like domain-containing protein [Lysobacter sp.]
MSVTLERLRLLKREAGKREPDKGESRRRDGVPLDVLPDAGARAIARPGPVALRRPDANGPAKPSIESLRRLLGVRERMPTPVALPRGPIDRSLPGEEIASGLRLIETWLPFAAPIEKLPLAFAKRDDAVDPRDLLFFDTETTGLAGGTGTRAFQIGAADWHQHPELGDGLRVRQLLITTLAAEPLMLRTFADWLAPSTVLSSYNGRCYDSPLLKTRYRLARLPCPITPLDHVDLLFPTRRRYRGVWENCRLATIERELLKIVREDDLPGSEAPAAWLSFLRGGSSSLLRRVCAHNHQDVVTLARLMLRLVAVHAEDNAGDAFTPP